MVQCPSPLNRLIIFIIPGACSYLSSFVQFLFMNSSSLISRNKSWSTWVRASANNLALVCRSVWILRWIIVTSFLPTSCRGNLRHWIIVFSSFLFLQIHELNQNAVLKTKKSREGEYLEDIWHLVRRADNWSTASGVKTTDCVRCRTASTNFESKLFSLTLERHTCTSRWTSLYNAAKLPQQIWTPGAWGCS